MSPAYWTAIENVPAVEKVCLIVPTDEALLATRFAALPFVIPVRVTFPLTGGGEAKPDGGLARTTKTASWPATTVAGGIKVICGTVLRSVCSVQLDTVRN